jgi:hypothetical protein
MASFFADSYAIIEILKGNERYLPYMTGHLVTTEFNICEVAFAVCRDYPEKTRQEWPVSERWLPLCQPRMKIIARVRP